MIHGLFLLVTNINSGNELLLYTTYTCKQVLNYWNNCIQKCKKSGGRYYDNRGLSVCEQIQYVVQSTVSLTSIIMILKGTITVNNATLSR